MGGCARQASCTVPAWGPHNFLLLVQEKVTKEKDAPVHRRYLASW